MHGASVLEAGIVRSKGDDAREEEALAKSVEAARKAAAAQLPAQKASPTNPNFLTPESTALLAQNPEWRALQFKLSRQSIGAAGTRDAIAAMKLPSETEKRLVALLASTADEQFKAQQAVLAEGGKPGSPELMKAQMAATQQVYGEIRELLGNEEYQRFKDLQKLEGAVQGYAYSFGADMETAGVPLTQDQALELARIQNGVPPAPVRDRATGLYPGEQALLDKASQTLSPQQFTILAEYFRMTGANERATQRAVDDARTAAGLGPNDSGTIELVIPSNGQIWPITFGPRGMYK
jgi:hypothetical protein